MNFAALPRQEASDMAKDGVVPATYMYMEGVTVENYGVRVGAGVCVRLCATKIQRDAGDALTVCHSIFARLL